MDKYDLLAILARVLTNSKKKISKCYVGENWIDVRLLFSESSITIFDDSIVVDNVILSCKEEFLDENIKDPGIKKLRAPIITFLEEIKKQYN